ncbi:MAG: hypothetical protein DI533_15480 [Cereibacter sphaeroides]|uniref:Glycosylase n=1 Tax=Cereibacter sphaeroides TaxID=1063 RepID=A0A2W5U182_CERSP|nr:MAG: hypothetical protein DI533_15480 [Cereibacter sphaeroides]
MQIEKLGRIFDPRDHRLPDGCITHAQSPQTLLTDEGVRIYFSTRSLDAAGGKFRSRIAFVDMTPGLEQILRVSDSTVIPLGGLGCFDEHGIFPMNVIRNGDEVWGYTCGWNRRVSVSVDTAIGLAISRDGGATFERQGDGPVLGPSLHEPFLVGDGFVLKAGARFHMWYIFGVRWGREDSGLPPDRVYKIGHAVSEDGIGWVKKDGMQIIPDVLGDDECQALPSVVRFGGTYHMAFCYRAIHGFRTDPTLGYRIGYARSDDLVRWTRDDAALGLVGTRGDWDADMQCYPHLFVLDDRLMLLYNGNAFGRDGFGLARVLP